MRLAPCVVRMDHSRGRLLVRTKVQLRHSLPPKQTFPASLTLSPCPHCLPAEL